MGRSQGGEQTVAESNRGLRADTEGGENEDREGGQQSVDAED